MTDRKINLQIFIPMSCRISNTSEAVMVTFYRRLPKLDYIRPESMDETIGLLSRADNGRYRVYAGGTDLIPKIKKRLLKTPEAIVDLKGIPGMDFIELDDKGGLRMGALSTVRSVAASPVVQERYSLLSQAAGSIASTQVQNRGTVAGNICSAVPSADSAPALLCLEADLLCIGEKGERIIAIEEFFTGPMESALHRNEILKEIRIPPLSEHTRGVYIKLSTRSRMDLAVVGVAVLTMVDEETVKMIRIALGAVGPTPMRAREAESVIQGQKATEERIRKAALKASEESRPIDDHRASAEYRRMMVEVLVRRGIHQCLSGLP
jgi:CO/xanthine dehydrogenase FAD-binding subunit